MFSYIPGRLSSSTVCITSSTLLWVIIDVMLIFALLIKFWLSQDR